MTLLQKTLDAVWHEQEHVDVIYGKEKVELANEIIDFFDAHENQIEGFGALDVTNDSIYQQVKNAIELGLKINEKFLQEIEKNQLEKEQQHQLNEGAQL